LARACAEVVRPPCDIAPDALAVLEAYAWPGNVRELRNAMERAVVLSRAGLVERGHLPDAVLTRPAKASTPSTATPGEPPSQSSQPVSLRDDLNDLERRRIVDALNQCAGNQTKAAKLLGLSRGALLLRLDAYGLPRPRGRKD
jgi:two-component system, NtrC family, response regulator AtoC